MIRSSQDSYLSMRRHMFEIFVSRPVTMTIRTFPVIILSILALYPASLALAIPWSIEPNVDTVGVSSDAGLYTSIALDSSGNVHISYYYPPSADLRYAKWNGSSWAITTVDSTGDVGKYSSIAVDSSDNVHISYRDVSRNRIKYAMWDPVNGWRTQDVDGPPSSGQYLGNYGTSITVDSSGNAHISYNYYRSSILGDLKYAKLTGSGWPRTVSIATAESGGTLGTVGLYSSIALDSGGNVHISYYNQTAGTLKYAKWASPSGPWNRMLVESGVGQYTSIAVDSGGNAHISYYNQTAGTLRYAYLTGSGWPRTVAAQLVDFISGGNVGRYTSIALDSSSNPHISYRAITGTRLKYAMWTGSAWSIEDVDATADVGTFSSIAIDNCNNPHISYYDYTYGRIRYAYGTAHELTATPSSNSPVCEGGTINLYGSASGGVEPYNYSWSGPGGWISTDQNPTRSNATTAMAGTYSLIVTDNNGCSSIPATTDVTVNARPIALASSNTPVCQGSTINLYGSPDGMQTYSWSGPGGWISTDQNPTRSNATTAMAGTYSLTVTDNNTCASNPATTVLNVSLRPSVTCSASSNLSFVGFPVSFSCTPSGGVPPYTFLGNFDDGITSTNQNPNHIYTGVGTFSTNAIVTDSIGCTGTCSTNITVGLLASPTEAASLPAALSPPPTTPRSSPSPPLVTHQLSPPNLMVQLLSVNPQQGYAGQPVTISTNVVNTGDEGGNYNIVLKINGLVEQTKMVSVGPQGTQPVKFTVTGAKPGTYTVDVGGQKGNFAILGLSGSTTRTHASGGLIAILIVGILIIATAVALMFTYRQSAY